MSARTITVSRIDFQRLQSLLNSYLVEVIGDDRTHLKKLRKKLEHATVVDSSDVSPDIVTMNSTFNLLNLDCDETDTFTLVYPDEACIAEGRLSILSPLGAGSFGQRVGEFLTLRLLYRETRRQVEKMTFQPERAGVFDL